MTIDELITLAAEAREDLGGDAQVRIATQPGYPLRAALQYVTIPFSPDPAELYAPMRPQPGRRTTARSCGWPPATSPTARIPTPRMGLARRLLHLTAQQPPPGPGNHPDQGALFL